MILVEVGIWNNRGKIVLVLLFESPRGTRHWPVYASRNRTLEARCRNCTDKQDGRAVAVRMDRTMNSDEYNVPLAALRDPSPRFTSLGYFIDEIRARRPKEALSRRSFVPRHLSRTTVYVAIDHPTNDL